MDIQNLGFYIAPACQMVREGCSKTADWACSFFKNLASSLVPSNKTRIYASVALITLVQMGLPLASAETWTAKDTAPTNKCCTPGFFVQMVKIVYQMLNNNALPNQIGYNTTDLPCPIYYANSNACLIVIPEFVRSDTGIHINSSNPDITKVSFIPAIPQIIVSTDCPNVPNDITNEVLKNIGIYMHIIPVEKK